MGSQVIRKVHNKEYLYYVYYDDKDRKEIYCGIASDPKSKTKACKTEIDELQSQKKRINKRIAELKMTR